MPQSATITMAATLKASTEGLYIIVDKARCKKGWNKTEQAWIDIASTSKATLRRFWAGVPIQAETFKAICNAVGIEDWESIVENETLDSNELLLGSKRLSFAIAGSIEEIEKYKLDAIVALLNKLGGDTSIEILDIDEGSVKLILGGSKNALSRIESLFEAGELTPKKTGFIVNDVHTIYPRELAQIIRKNGGCSLDLRNADLSETNLSHINLSCAQLSKANLAKTNLLGANLNNADLAEAVLRSANLRNASLVESNMHEANLEGADLHNANLRNANGVRITFLRTTLNGANLSGANLIGGYMISANLRGADLSDADLGGANLNSANLSDANLDSADLSRATLNNADLSRANLTHANLSNVVLRASYLNDADLSHADLSHADLSHADLFGADLSRTTVRQTLFSVGMGLSEEQKKELTQRGAIFVDIPGDNVSQNAPAPAPRR